MSFHIELKASQREGIARGRFVRVHLPLAMQQVSLLVGRVEGSWRAYANVCPHRSVPLDFGGMPPMSDDGQYLLCNQHGALFRLDDGVCVEGPCIGDALTAVEVVGEGEGIRVVDVDDAGAAGRVPLSGI